MHSFRAKPPRLESRPRAAHHSNGKTDDLWEIHYVLNHQETEKSDNG